MQLSVVCVIKTYSVSCNGGSGSNVAFLSVVCTVGFYRAGSYASVVLGVVILSVRHTGPLWQNQTMHCGYFDTTRNGNHSAILTLTVVGGRCPLLCEICAQSDPPPFEKRQLRPISAHNNSTVRDSEKSSIMTNIKSAMGFPSSYRWSAYVTPKSRNCLLYTSDAADE